VTNLGAQLSGVPGVLSAAELSATAAHLASLQLASGQIPWFDGGHSDPWNLVESAMALSVAGHPEGARAAYRWLAAHQLGEGGWFNYYRGAAVKDARLDTNVCAYLATGVLHYLLVTGDADFAFAMWPHVERAIEFVLAWQMPDGTIRWSLDAAGRPEAYALLTGSSSIFHSLRSAVALAQRFDLARPAWELAAGRLGHAVANHPGAFAPKNEFAMDWYYPLLSGALQGEAAEARLADGWERHVMADYGVRCVSTSDWVTAAETAECVLALDAMGATSRALELLALTRRHRRDDGAYWTGLAYPGEVTFPDRETSSYTAAAVILAVDAVTSSTGAADLFRHGFLPAPIDLCEPGCPLAGSAASQHA
jgi:MMP endo-(1,4)-3-O-methyl-alpha-D-mannosidase